MGLFGSNKKEKYLLAWQKALLPNSSNKLVMTENDLINSTKEQLLSALNFVIDSSKIVQSTANPSVFFSRYKTMEMRITAVFHLEPYANALNAKIDLQKLYHDILNDKQKGIKPLINRYWRRVVEAAQKSKRPSTVEKKYRDFFDNMEKYKNELSAEQINYYTKLYQDAKNVLAVKSNVISNDESAKTAAVEEYFNTKIPKEDLALKKEVAEMFLSDSPTYSTIVGDRNKIRLYSRVLQSYYQLLRAKNPVLDEMKYYTIETCGDCAVCKHCEKLQGRKFDMKDAVVGVTYPPFFKCKGDVCRCFVVTGFKDEE